MSQNSYTGSMNILGLNFRGLRSFPTIMNLKDLVWRYKPDIIFLTKTTNTSEFCERIRQRQRMDYAENVEANGLSGGLALWWNKNICMVVNYKSEISLIVASFQERHGEFGYGSGTSMIYDTTGKIRRKPENST